MNRRAANRRSRAAPARTAAGPAGPAYESMPISKPFDLRIELPGSKSYANRAIVCAALTNARCTIRNISPSDDTALMLNVLADLGWQAARPNPVSSDVTLMPPAKPFIPPHPVQIWAGAAGTVARFAAALLTVVPGQFVLDGDERMRERPMGPLLNALRQLGANIEDRGRSGHLPVEIEGASLRGGKCTVPGGISSQFVSALLMVAPTRGASVEIEVDGDLVSKPYADMTIEVMKEFGLAVERDEYRRFWRATVPAACGPEARAPYTCPPDATAAGYFWGAAAVTGSKCVIDGLTRQDAQGDAALVALLKQMGCGAIELPDGLGIDATGVLLRPINADMSAMPDSALTLAVVCAFAEGTSRLTGLGTLREKETDRIEALRAELSKLGAGVRAGPDWLEIDGAGNKSPERKRRVTVQTYNDHRMAMSLAIASLRLPLTIENPKCVSKSFPTFWECWSRLK